MKQTDRWATPLNWLLMAFLFAYPFVVYFGLKNFSVRYLGPWLAIILALRFLLMRKTAKVASAFLWVMVVSAGFNLLAGFSDNAYLLRMHPLIVSVALFVVFSSSLWSEQSMIERFARLREKNWSQAATIYTRRVTMVWCGFFLINGSIAAYTIFFSSLEAWAFYNGFISYILMGTLLVTEFLFRRFYLLRVGRVHEKESGP